MILSYRHILPIRPFIYNTIKFILISCPSASSYLALLPQSTSNIFHNHHTNLQQPPHQSLPTNNKILILPKNNHPPTNPPTKMQFTALLTSALTALLLTTQTTALPQAITATTPFATHLCEGEHYGGTCQAYFSAENSCMLIGPILADKVSSFTITYGSYCVFYDVEACPHREWSQSGVAGGFLMATSALETLGSVFNEKIRSYKCFKKTAGGRRCRRGWGLGGEG